MSQAYSSEQVGQADGWELAGGWKIESEAETDSEDPDTVLLHETGARIMLDTQEEGVELRVILANGELVTFVGAVSDPEATAKRVAREYTAAADIEASSSDDDSMLRYYAVTNPYGHGPLPLCRQGGDIAVYDSPTKAAVVCARIRHRYGNENLKVTQLDRTPVPEL